MKLCTVVGARPQFIKAAAFQRALKENPNAPDHILIHTGQHFDDNMSEIFFEEMKIDPPDYHLNIHDSTHGAMTGHMLIRLEEILLKEKPDWVIVYGDTNSTLAAALAASKLQIPLAHIEAGLRSFNRQMPEEINRIVTDHVADILFTPNEAAAEQLLHEGIDKSKIFMVGDVMYDLAKRVPTSTKILEQLSLRPKNYILATIHRAENTDDPSRLNEIFQGLSELSKETPVVLPLHPRTKQALGDQSFPSITFIEPAGYLEMASLEKGAKLIITDSGGVQKEAFFHRIPCVTVREETEWTELVEGGYVHLCPADRNDIVEKAHLAMDSHPDWDRQFYGNGDASDKILQRLMQYHL
jgi:UDP-GlcNAc3NAcA epimerase